MDIDCCFKLCRICLRSEEFTNLTSIIDDRGEISKNLKSISNVDISADINKRPVKICERCLSKLEQAQKIRAKTRDAEQFYFDKQRRRSSTCEENAYDGILNFSFRVCRMCLTPHSNTVLMQSLVEKGELYAAKFKLVFGIETSRDNKASREMLACGPCIEDLNKCFALREQIRESNRFLNLKLMRPAAAGFVEPGSNETAKKKTNNDEVTGVSSEGVSEKVSVAKGELINPIEVNEAKLICDFCGIAFNCKSKLIQHIEAVHFNIKRFSCSICKKMFYSERDEEKHLKNAHVNRLQSLGVYNSSRRYKCRHKDCNKFFKTTRCLHMHKLTHLDVRPFQCSQCSKSYTTRQNVNRHEMTHLAVRPFACKCGKTFTRKDHFRTHQIRTHGEAHAASK